MIDRRTRRATAPAWSASLGAGLVAGLAGLAVTTAASTARAQSAIPSTNGAGFDTHLFRPAMDSKGLFTVNGSDILGKNEISFGMVIDYGHDLLRTATGPGTTGATGQLIDHSFQGTFQFNYGLLNMFVVGLDLPIDLMSGSQQVSNNVEPPLYAPVWSPNQLAYQGLAFAAVHAKWRITRVEHGFGLALGVQAGGGFSDAAGERRRRQRLLVLASAHPREALRAQGRVSHRGQRGLPRALGHVHRHAAQRRHVRGRGSRHVRRRYLHPRPRAPGPRGRDVRDVPARQRRRQRRQAQQRGRRRHQGLRRAKLLPDDGRAARATPTASRPPTSARSSASSSSRRSATATATASRTTSTSARTIRRTSTASRTRTAAPTPTTTTTASPTSTTAASTCPRTATATRTRTAAPRAATAIATATASSTPRTSAPTIPRTATASRTRTAAPIRTTTRTASPTRWTSARTIRRTRTASRTRTAAPIPTTTTTASPTSSTSARTSPRPSTGSRTRTAAPTRGASSSRTTTSSSSTRSSSPTTRPRSCPASNKILDAVATTIIAPPRVHAHRGRGPRRRARRATQYNLRLTQDRVNSVMRGPHRARHRPSHAYAARATASTARSRTRHNEEAWEQNRRVEFKIVKTKDGPTGVELGCENAKKHGVSPDPVP